MRTSARDRIISLYTVVKKTAESVYGLLRTVIPRRFMHKQSPGSLEPGFVLFGGLPHQSDDWFAMTELFNDLFRDIHGAVLGLLENAAHIFADDTDAKQLNAAQQ